MELSDELLDRILEAAKNKTLKIRIVDEHKES